MYHHLSLKLKPINPQTLLPFRHLSSSSLPVFPDSIQNPQTTSNFPNPNSTPLSDIKQRLKSAQPSPPPPSASDGTGGGVSIEKIRKTLAEFHLRSPNHNQSPNPNASPISFQELFRKNNNESSNNQETSSRLAFDSIRNSLRGLKQAPKGSVSRFGVKSDANNNSGVGLFGDQEKYPDSIFGREIREKMGEKEQGETVTEANKGVLRTEFVKIYDHKELGEKLRRLRPDDAEKGGGGDWFSLEELNVRLAKLRELEDKERESRMGGVQYSDLRKSLIKLKDSEAQKKTNMQRMSILSGFNMQSTPSFMLKRPQEHLLDNYFHPDHMSSAEKMKLKLKKVRDEFKMSESDCGSARVQIAQLTTKIKHLSSVLHKKDKHSRKGLNEMVQQRKKLLKYLRRTDWDSYCLVLSKLGLRDVPEYKVPDYKC